MSILPLSVAIVTLNEEANIARCLKSVSSLAQEIVVVDSGSTDRTVEIAEQYGARVIQHAWLGHVGQKNLAWKQCREPWVLSLDADEQLSPELAISIEHTLLAAKAFDCYAVNRRTFYMGDWIWHAWYPEWRPRLARSDKARWSGTDPHDYLDTDGTMSRLPGDLLHYSYTDLADHLQRTIKYARIGALADIQKGKRFRWYKLVFSPWVRFWRCMLVKQAWRDGWRGWIIAASALIAATAKYAFVYEHERNEHLARKI